MTDHLSIEQLSDFADGQVADAELVAIERHLAACQDCSATLARLQTLLRAAAELTAEVEVPAELWRGVSARVAARPSSAPLPPTLERPARRRIVAEPWMLAAAAVVLVVATSTVTTFVVRRSPPPAAQPSAAVNGPMEVLPAARVVDKQYERSIAELTETLAAQRARLAPATIAKVEASLRVIDQAIAEAQRALAQDPASRTLLDVLSANYERKLELLRRAAELPSST